MPYLIRILGLQYSCSYTGRRAPYCIASVIQPECIYPQSSYWGAVRKIWHVLASYRKCKTRLEIQSTTPRSSFHVVTIVCCCSALPKRCGIPPNLLAGVLVAVTFSESVYRSIHHQGEISRLQKVCRVADEVRIVESIAWRLQPGSLVTIPKHKLPLVECRWSARPHQLQSDRLASAQGTR